MGEIFIERINSRIREFLTDSQPVIGYIKEKYPAAILLIKHEMDFPSRFIQQKHYEVNYLLKKNFIHFQYIGHLSVFKSGN